MKHSFKVLGLVALLSANTAFAASVMQFTQPAKMTSSFKSDINSITSNSSNVEKYTDNNGKTAWRVLYNSSVNAKMSKYGITANDSGYQALSTVWDYETLDEDGRYHPFQCVGFVKAASDIIDDEKGRAKLWQKGQRVTASNLPPSGTVIATFFGEDAVEGTNDDGPYGGHTAIFVSGNSSRIYVIDQNYHGDGIMRVHAIPFNGDGIREADNYYVVNH